MIPKFNYTGSKYIVNVFCTGGVSPKTCLFPVSMIRRCAI